MARSLAPLTLYIPAALGSISADTPSVSPTLDRLIARGDGRRTHLRGDGVVLSLMGGDGANGSGRGAVAHYTQSGALQSDSWHIVASPLHLQADHQTLHLPALQPLPLREAESRALFAATQAFFAEEGWQLHYGDGHHWQLHLTAHTAITTTAPEEAAGRSLFETLPQGNDASIWRRWSNEAQMLFHTHRVNEERRTRGEPTINSLWFWGEGRLPQLNTTPFKRIVGGDVYVQGLARLSNTTWQPLPAGSGELAPLLDKGPLLLVLDRAARDDWERLWFTSIAALLRQRKLAAVELHFQDGHAVRITPLMLWRFWRRAQLTLSGV